MNLQILHLISELIFYQLLQKKSHHVFSGLLLAEFLVAYGQSLRSTRNSKNQYLHDALMDLNSNCFALSMLMTWHFTCVMSETLLSLVASSLPYIVLLEKVPLSREKVEDLLIIILTLTMLTWLLLLLGLSNFRVLSLSFHYCLDWGIGESWRFLIKA